MILHVSADFPDAIDAAKTPVVRRLTDLIAGRFAQRIVSLNRRPPGVGLVRAAATRGGWPDIVVADVTDGVTSVTYHAPGRGVLHRTLLLRLGDWIAHQSTQGPTPRLMVGYKLTIEGIAVARAAARLGIPYAIVIQGNTDLRILRARPDLRASLARVFHGAATVFAFAPWALDGVERYLGVRRGETMVLPCPMADDAILPPRVGDGTILSAFHLRNWRGKNAARLIAAAARARVEVPDLRVTIVGGGTTAETAALAALADGGAVTLAGPLANAAMPARMNAASGFALPSRAESFGLVFVEALFAGTPILYPRGTSVDGYFDGQPFAVPVDAGDIRAVADGLKRLYREEAALKAALATWQAGPGPDRFRTETIAREFGDSLARLWC
jgi:glycosyltransferase involved in cell wall biosynthesis